MANTPKNLRRRVIQDSLWNAEFSLLLCPNFENAGDVYNALGSMTRSAQFLVQAWFALNEKYFVSDKYTTRLVDQFALRRCDFTTRVAQILLHPGGTPAELRHSSRLLTSLWREIVGLASGPYKPRYDLSDASFGNQKAGSK